MTALNALAALRMAEVHVPGWKCGEIERTMGDCEWALLCAERVAA
jgi:hypothetical protein